MVGMMWVVLGQTSRHRHCRGIRLDRKWSDPQILDTCLQWVHSSCHPNHHHLHRPTVVDPMGIHPIPRSGHSNLGRGCRIVHLHRCQSLASNWLDDGLHPSRVLPTGRTSRHRPCLGIRWCLAKISRCWHNHRWSWQNHHHRYLRSHGVHTRCNPQSKDTCPRSVRSDYLQIHRHLRHPIDPLSWATHRGDWG